MPGKLEILILCAVLAAATSNAVAQEPAGVKATLDAARAACRQAKGLRLVLAPQAIRSIDLTGDGRADYIVDFTHSRCERRENIFCGTGGCQIAIVVALRNGKFREVFRQIVHAYTIEPGEGARAVRFHLHGVFCGKTGPEPCIKQRRITTRPFSFKEPF